MIQDTINVRIAHHTYRLTVEVNPKVTVFGRQSRIQTSWFLESEDILLFECRLTLLK